MAFWGVYIKPNEPYILRYDDDDVAVPKRLRVTQATLGDAIRNSPARSIVRCSIGNKPEIAICSLSVRELTCCQLELEFEESCDVIFSVKGPRGVHLAGYLITHAPIAQHLSLDHKGQERATMEIAGCSNEGLHKDELDSNKTGSIKESVEAQNTEIEQSDKNMEGETHLRKCIKDKHTEGEISIAVDRKMRKDDSVVSSSDETREKTISVKTRSEEHSRDGSEKKKKKKKRNKNSKRRKLSALEATASECVNNLSNEKLGSDSRITEENGSHDNRKEKKKKKRKRKHTLDHDKDHIMGDINGQSNKFDSQSQKSTSANVEDDSSGKVQSMEHERKISKMVFTTKMVS